MHIFMLYPDLSRDFSDAEYDAMVAPMHETIEGSPSSAVRHMDRPIPPTVEGGRRPEGQVIDHGAQFYKT